MTPYRVEPGPRPPLAQMTSPAFRARFEERKKILRFGPDHRYLAFFALPDIWALDRENYARRPGEKGTAYVLERVEKFCGSDLRNGRCSLVLDLSIEGHPYHHQSFVDLHRWCSAQQIAPRRVAIVSQNRALATAYRAHFPPQFESVQILVHDFFIGSLARALEQEGTAFQRAIGFEKESRQVSNSGSEIATFLCLNATPRPIRICVLAALSASGVLDDTLWSLLKEASGKRTFQISDVHELLIRFGLEDLLPFATGILNGPPKVLDEIKISNSNQLAGNINLSLFDRTFMSIVTETEFTQGENIRITEKTVKSLAMGHPTVVFGNPRSLELAKRFGFETFSPFIDETYDEICDPATRLGFALRAIVDLRPRLANKFSQDRERLLQIGKANLAHAFSGGFRRRYEEVVENPLVTAMEKLTR